MNLIAGEGQARGGGLLVGGGRPARLPQVYLIRIMNEISVQSCKYIVVLFFSAIHTVLLCSLFAMC